MEHMRKCVVGYLDLAGMSKKLADAEQRPSAIRAMEELDRICGARANDVQQIDHIYCWNDSALFLTFLDYPPRDMSLLLAELSRIKRDIDTACRMKSYIAIVKGKSFQPNPNAPAHAGANPNPKYHYLMASSMAFANCDIIIKMFSKDHHDWYIDSRIQQELNDSLQRKLTERGRFKAFPTMNERKVFTAEGYLHQ